MALDLSDLTAYPGTELRSRTLSVVVPASSAAIVAQCNDSPRLVAKTMTTPGASAAPAAAASGYHYKDEGRDSRLNMSSERRFEKADRAEFNRVAVKSCAQFWDVFNECAKGRSFSIPFVCRDQFANANACMYV